MLPAIRRATSQPVVEEPRQHDERINGTIILEFESDIDRHDLLERRD